MSRLSAGALCALLLTVSAVAQTATTAADPTVAAILEEGKARSEVMTHLDHLTNRIGPRLTSSDRLTQAQEWAADRLRSYGLEVKLEQWGTFPVGFNRGPWFGRMVSPTIEALTFTTPAWTRGTTGKERGAALLAPTTVEEMAKLKGQFAGKWVIEPFATGLRGRPSPIDRELRQALNEAYVDEGILGVILSSGSDLVRTSGNYRTSMDDLDPYCQILLQGPQFDGLKARLEKGEPVELEFDIRNWFRDGPIPLYNVVADLKGSEKPDEVVIIGGHIDSWDGATGTTDNGTGTATTIEAARILTKVGARPKRTIRFMLWSGEEQGLLGSRAWVRAHQSELEKISAVFVHDGGTNYASGISCTTQMEPHFKKIFAPVIGLSEEMPFEISAAERLRQGGGSDHASFLSFGVPGFFWKQSGRATYGYGWHTQNDTYDLAIPEYQEQTATIAAIAAYGVANLPVLLPREGLRSTAEAIPTARRLGVQLEDGTLKVSEVVPERVAATAGLKAGDVLIAIDDVQLKDRFVLREALQAGEPKKTLTLQREGKTMKVELKFPR